MLLIASAVLVGTVAMIAGGLAWDTRERRAWRRRLMQERAKRHERSQPE
jgi:hypothetical protein